MSESGRRPLVAGNWKLHKTRAEARQLVAELRQQIPAGAACEVAVAPVFTALSAVREALEGSDLLLAAQNVYWEGQGAYTGEVSAPLLADAGCRYVIVGHSERRELFGETDADVARKAAAVLDAGLSPIVCVGESLDQREAGNALPHVAAQIEGSLSGLSTDALSRVVVAYEPIWAIGTGRTAQPEDAQEVHAHVRERLAALAGADVARGARILYGGSVKPGNAAALMAQPDIDGALVGGASLEATSFAAIVAAAAQG